MDLATKKMASNELAMHGLLGAKLYFLKLTKVLPALLCAQNICFLQDTKNSH